MVATKLGSPLTLNILDTWCSKLIEVLTNFKFI